MFLRNSWYVFDWHSALRQANGIMGRTVLGEPLVVWRDGEGDLHAMEDRCPHRHAPLSMGRVEGRTLRCIYHGSLFDTAGRCVQVPGLTEPPDMGVKTYPVVEKNSWIWVWMGDPARADETLIPDAFGLDDPQCPMRGGHIEYDAHYQLVHDNLCDMSHIDFLHESTLRPLTGAHWAQREPRVTTTGRGLRFERWFPSADAPDGSATRVDVWSSYDFIVPGIFIMKTGRFAEGTAAQCGYKAPEGATPINQIREQQAVTPISRERTAYFFATGVVGGKAQLTPDVNTRIDVVQATFDEDRRMIESQQRIWKLTPTGEKKVFLPQDKGPFMMRKLMARLIDQETEPSPPPPQL